MAEQLDLSLPQLENLIEGNGEVLSPNGHVVPPWLDHYASLEQAAARLQTFEPIAIPGLLQTEAYATAVMRASHLPVSEETIGRRVQARIARQAVLDRQPQPLELICVIDESVLSRVTGTREVMAAQLAHLMDMARRPSIQLHLVRADSNALHCATFGSFRLFTSEGAVTPFVTCTENLTGFNYLDRPAAIDAHAQLFEHLVSAALSPSISLDLLHETAERYQ